MSESKSIAVATNLPEPQHRLLKVLAARRGQTIRDLAAELIQAHDLEALVRGSLAEDSDAA